MLGDVNKLFVFKSLLTTTSNVLPLHLKQTFSPIIWIFTEDEGDGIESRLPFKICSTLSKFWNHVWWINYFFVKSLQNRIACSEYQLRINYVQEKDEGVYECQISTNPISTFYVRLKVRPGGKTNNFGLIYPIWQYRLWSFQGRDKKLEKFLAKNQL